MKNLLKALLLLIIVTGSGNLFAQESTLLGKDYDYMKTYFNVEGNYTYHTDKIDEKMTFVTANLFDHKKELIETRYYTFADDKGKLIFQKLEIMKPFTEENWKSSANSLIAEGYDETSYFLEELVTENSKEMTPVYRSQNSEKYKIPHYMTLSKFDTGEGMLTKIAFFLNTSAFINSASTVKEHKEYYNSGKLRLSTFVNARGYFEGDYKSYHENGKIKEIGIFKGKERPEGQFKAFYEDGRLQLLSNYRNGQLDGKYEEYYQNGKLKMTGNYIGGKMDGEFKLYKETGEISRQETYKGDIKINE